MSATIPAALAEVISEIGEWEDRAEFPPGPQLACALSGGLSGLTDLELAENIAAARRQTSWAQALELAAIAELSARRIAAAKADRGWWCSRTHRAVAAEVSLMLTLTPARAIAQVDLAMQLAEQLPDTLAALRTGLIDLARATALADGVRGLDDHTVRLVEDTVLPQAPDLTTGQLRAKIRAIIKLIDPDGYEERRRNARTGRRLEVYDTPVGTADLAVRDITTEVAHAIYNRLTAAANGMKNDGDTRPLDAIRADLTCDLLRGTPLPAAIRTLITTTPEHADEAAHRDQPEPATQADRDAQGGHSDKAQHHASPRRSGCGEQSELGRLGERGGDGVCGWWDGRPGQSGLVRPGERGEHGEHAERGGQDSRQGWKGVHPEEGSLAGREGAGWWGASGTGAGGSCDGLALSAPGVTRVDGGAVMGGAHLLWGDGEPGWAKDAAIGAGIADAVQRQLSATLAHARAAGRLDLAAAQLNHTAQAMADALARLKGPWCAATGGKRPGGHGHQRYRPPAAMRRLIEERHPTCVFPSCNRRSGNCDIDHTRPYDQNGLTCLCNLAPLCRSHHQLKQHPQWKLLQLWPGLLLWLTPSGQWHLVLSHARM